MGKLKEYNAAKEEQYKKVIEYLKENYPTDFDNLCNSKIIINSEGTVWIGETEIQTDIKINYERTKQKRYANKTFIHRPIQSNSFGVQPHISATNQWSFYIGS